MKCTERGQRLIIICLTLLAFSCNYSKSPDNSDNTSTIIEDSVSKTKDSDSLEASSKVTHTFNLIEKKIAPVSDSLLHWGFGPQNEKLLDSREQFNKHWWLKIFNKNREYTPSPKAWNNIRHIRQFWFKKKWSFLIEEWTFNDEKGADQWLQIALDTKELDDVKPPRAYWVENNKLYFVMATAAADWFEFGDNVTTIFSGKKPALISLMNEPIKLRKFKLKQRQSNSGIWSHKSYFYKPDTVGIYYNYFIFQKLMRRYGNEAIHGLKIGTYVYGKEIGNYEDVVEELISIKAKLNAADLKFDIVGMMKEELEGLLGTNYLRKGQNIVYTHDKTLYIVHLEDGKVVWFRYIKTNTIFDEVENIPLELFEYDSV